MAAESRIESGNCSAWAAKDPFGLLSPHTFNSRYSLILISPGKAAGKAIYGAGGTCTVSTVQSTTVSTVQSTTVSTVPGSILTSYLFPVQSTMVPIPEAPLEPVQLQPQIYSHSPGARAEILREVHGRFPNRAAWPEICVVVIRNSTFVKRCRFADDDGGKDFDLVFLAIQEAEWADPMQAARWRRFKATSPSRLNIRPPSFEQLAKIPLDVLPPGVSPPLLL
ncbi:putative cinnamyl alcohol dehydrogenase 1 [Hordeum vulgare]|nr:putative cinnamyl alcohol dehydrogenase 1 [Hordeum vulgare]